MVKIKLFFLFVFLGSVCFVQSQTVELNGVVTADTDVENIHVINKTSNKFATTNKLGGFKIQAKIFDTIVFSSVQYKIKALVVTSKNIQEKSILVHLSEFVNILEEVLLGKVLTGDLNSDIKNSDAERPIDFYDVGIPGYTGKPKTQNERRLYEADNGKYVSIGLGLGLNLNKILNKISGRTKKLKERVRLESNDVLLYSIKARLSEDFFATYPLDESLHPDFFYFCSDDENFKIKCAGRSDIEVFEFLAEKIIEYKNNLNTIKD